MGAFSPASFLKVCLVLHPTEYGGTTSLFGSDEHCSCSYCEALLSGLLVYFLCRCQASVKLFNISKLMLAMGPILSLFGGGVSGSGKGLFWAVVAP